MYSKSKTLVLVGSGEFTKAMDTVDSYVLSFTDTSNRKISVLPTAASQEHDYKKWVNMAQDHFAKFGYEVVFIDVVDKKSANDKTIVDALRSCGLIYFSGGDPGHLHNCLYESYLAQVVLELYSNGAVLVGSSAGAMAFGNNILSNVYELKDGGKKVSWKPSLALVNKAILAHYDYILTEDKPLFDKVMANTPNEIKSNYIGIDENTALLIADDADAMVLGQSSVHIFTNGYEKIYSTGSSFNFR